MADPIVFNNKAIDRGLASSTDFNSLIADIFQDMNSLSSAINDNQKILVETTSMIRHDNDSLLSRISMLEYKLKDSEDMFSALKSGLKTVSIRSLIGDSDNIVTRNNFDVSDMYNVGYPRITKSYEKLRITDTPNPELYVKVSEAYSSNPYTIDIFNSPIFVYDNVSTPDLNCMFDGSYDLFFARSAKSQNALDTDSLYVMMNISIPLNTVNNLKTNCIKINPIPKYALDVMSIEYKDSVTGNWVSIPNLINSDNSKKIIENIPSIMITFPTVETTEIRLVVRQSRHTTTRAYDNTLITEFFYGFQEVGLQLLETTPNEVTFITKVKLDMDDAFFKSMISAELIVDDYLNQNIDCKFTLYKDSDGSGVSNAIDFGDTIMSDNNVLYLETAINTKGTVIPVIKGIKAICEVK